MLSFVIVVGSTPAVSADCFLSVTFSPFIFLDSRKTNPIENSLERLRFRLYSLDCLYTTDLDDGRA